MERKNTSAAIEAYRKAIGTKSLTMSLIATSFCSFHLWRRVQNGTQASWLWRSFFAYLLILFFWFYVQKWMTVITGRGMDWVKHMKSSRCHFTACTTTDRHINLGMPSFLSTVLLYRYTWRLVCPILLSSVICYLTDARRHGIYLFYTRKKC